MTEPQIGECYADQTGSTKNHGAKELNDMDISKSDYLRGSLSDIVEEDRSSFDVCC